MIVILIMKYDLLPGKGTVGNFFNNTELLAWIDTSVCTEYCNNGTSFKEN